MEEESTLVVAWDGLDKNLIDKFDLDFFKSRKEYGRIDNTTGMSGRVTSELFASFITGETYGEHGIKGLKKTTDTVDKINKYWPLNAEIPGSYRLKQMLKIALGAKDYEKNRKYRKEDLETDTLFEKIENSRSICVPSYDTSILWLIEGDMRPLRFGYSHSETTQHFKSRELEYRKRELYSELENDIVGARDFLMCQFQYPDMFQHLFGDKQSSGKISDNYDEEKLFEMYKNIEEISKSIEKKAKAAGYENIIFMSDHGLPGTDMGHNEYAFYSSNKEIFGDEIPHITDFHDRFVSNS